MTACSTPAVAAPGHGIGMKQIIAAAHDHCGVPEWRTRPGNYDGLARIIAYQQLSTKAAGTIWGRAASAEPKGCCRPTSQ